MKKRYPPSLEENIKQTNKKDQQTSLYKKLWPTVVSIFRISAVKDYHTQLNVSLYLSLLTSYGRSSICSKRKKTSPLLVTLNDLRCSRPYHNEVHEYTKGQYPLGARENAGMSFLDSLRKNNTICHYESVTRWS